MDELPALIVDELAARALREDLGHGRDITTQTLIPAAHRGTLVMGARQNGVLAGTALAAAAFRLTDPALSISVLKTDGQSLAAGDHILRVEGSARAILTAERTALNYMTHLSGIATLTAAYVREVAGTKARIVCTRKTIPGLRLVQKYAVRLGGGHNHRFGLDDGILIKDNHIALAGGVGAALDLAKRQAGHMVRVEVEVDSLAQLEEALAHGADAILLDNMNPAQLREAVAMIGGRAVSEASGGITLAGVRAVAEAGVDLISVGALTHSAPALDIGLDIQI